MTFSPSPALYPFESRWHDGSAARVHYVDEGAGRPILMCHGNPTWSFLYRGLIESLRGEFRCVAVDYPGFGLSERPAGYGYTPAEHARAVGELVRALDLRDLVVMGHDWGGPIGLSVACSEPDRIAGVVLGNTWFWPPDRRARVFSRVMSSRPLQRAILKHNMFVERLLPAGIARTLEPAEMEHYRAVQPTPEARVGVAELPRQIVAAGPWLAELADAVPRELGAKRALITYPMRDAAFPAKAMLPRIRAAFGDVEVVELPEAKHFFLEDAPGEVAAAIARRFGSA
ncbi:MAG TPA: alpha/beta fold hydrolase [Thermoleophilaceae bacterium]|jgi:haloalkane dehalogenase